MTRRTQAGQGQNLGERGHEEHFGSLFDFLELVSVLLHPDLHRHLLLKTVRGSAHVCPLYIINIGIYTNILYHDIHIYIFIYIALCHA